MPKSKKIYMHSVSLHFVNIHFVNISTLHSLRPTHELIHSYSYLYNKVHKKGTNEFFSSILILFQCNIVWLDMLKKLHYFLLFRPGMTILKGFW